MKLPTGGNPCLDMVSPRALLLMSIRQEVSRSGVTPEPTVIVRMKEDTTAILNGSPTGLPLAAFPCPDSGNHLTYQDTYHGSVFTLAIWFPFTTH